MHLKKSVSQLAGDTLCQKDVTGVKLWLQLLQRKRKLEQSKQQVSASPTSLPAWWRQHGNLETHTGHRSPSLRESLFVAFATVVLVKSPLCTPCNKQDNPLPGGRFLKNNNLQQRNLILCHYFWTTDHLIVDYPSHILCRRQCRSNNELSRERISDMLEMCFTCLDKPGGTLEGGAQRVPYCVFTMQDFSEETLQREEKGWTECGDKPIWCAKHGGGGSSWRRRT